MAGRVAKKHSRRLFAVVPAAGKSTRYGSFKLVEPAGTSCLLGVVLENVLGCEELAGVIVVLGYRYERVLEALGGLGRRKGLKVVVNKEFELGMSTSIKRGVEEAIREGADGVLFVPGDMPRITAHLITRVLAGYRESGASVCFVKRKDGIPGHPILVDKRLFEELLGIEGDRGAKAVVAEHMEQACSIDPGESAGDFTLDIDTREDMDRFLSH